jgi:hypothetical protein
MALDQQVRDDAMEAYSVRRSRLACELADELQAVLLVGSNQPITVSNFGKLAGANMRQRSTAATEDVIAACQRHQVKPNAHLADDMSSVWDAITTADPQSVAAEVQQRSGALHLNIRERCIQDQAQGRAEAIITFKAFVSEIELSKRRRRTETLASIARWCGTGLWKLLVGLGCIAWITKQILSEWPAIAARLSHH